MNKEDQNKNPTSNINFPTGIKWEWDDYRKCLTYKTYNFKRLLSVY